MPVVRFHLYFIGLLLLGAVIYFPPVALLARFASGNETYSHIPLIPLVSLFLLALQRKVIFAQCAPAPALGGAVCAVGLGFYALASMLRESAASLTFRGQETPNDFLALCMAGAVAWVIGSFLAVYGAHAFRKARFAILFLIFSIPLPSFLLNGIVTALQHASAEASDLVFRLAGASYHRRGLVFEFSNVAVMVAEQCSGIRSSLSLFILSILSGAMFLRTLSRRIVLAIAIFPITVVKNALRIVSITLLANYVDPRFLSTHWLHSSGGIPFFAVALALLIPLVWALRRSETSSRKEGAAG
ncbi:MAG: archaeosortase/exosortase family protein [Desulfobacterales bacterium]|jgi:exosortase|nr:archaeosortase/exosortase family protein [Desulfobacterales bacterium]